MRVLFRPRARHCKSAATTPCVVCVALTGPAHHSAVYVALLVCHGVVASLATSVIARLQGIYVVLNILSVSLTICEYQADRTSRVLEQALLRNHCRIAYSHSSRVQELGFLRLWRVRKLWVVAEWKQANMP